jgi:hypothetical protein
VVIAPRIEFSVVLHAEDRVTPKDAYTPPAPIAAAGVR